MKRPKFTCSEETLSMAIFGKRGVITRRLAGNGISPDQFGLENMYQFLDIIPELEGCKIGQKTIASTGDILRTVPDANVPRGGERHSVLVKGFEGKNVAIADDNGDYRVSKEQLYREWNRTGNTYVRCRPAR
jgi:hypothetical protein